MNNSIAFGVLENTVTMQQRAITQLQDLYDEQKAFVIKLSDDVAKQASRIGQLELQLRRLNTIRVQR